MKLKKLLCLCLSVLVLSLSLSSMVFASPNDGDKDVHLIFTNDVHGSAKPEYDKKTSEMDEIGYSRVKGYVNTLDQNSTILLDVGDSMQGNSFTSVDKGEGVAKIVNSMNYTATVPGNHEFDYSLDQLQKNYDIWGTDVVCVNARNNGELMYAPYKIQEVNGVKVGILGVTTPECGEDAAGKEGLDSVDFGTKDSIIQDTKNATDELKSQGCDLIVALSHIGLGDDQEISSADIANADSDIDVILDGHVHKVYSEQVNGVWITSAGSNLKDLGQVDVTVHQDGTKDINCSTLPAKDFANVTPDPTTEAVVQSVNDEHDVVLDVPVGYTPIELNRHNARHQECNLGKLYADSYLQASGADMVMVNGGGFRNSIEQGEITKGDVLNATPFNNNVVVVQMTGQQILDQMNIVLQEGSDMPLVSGVEYTATQEITKASDGYDDYTGQIVSLTKDGEKLNANQTYTVATYDYLSQGGSSYDIMPTCPVVKTIGGQNEIVEQYLQTVDFDALQGEQYITFVPDDGSYNFDASNILNYNDGMSAITIVLICVLAAVVIAIVVVLIVKKNKKTSVNNKN